ncbi:MAG: mechanosensitive ion channel family protein [Candidatus Omnitrophota bacterium]
MIPEFLQGRGPIVSKMIASLIIVAVVVAISKIIGVIFGRWEKRTLNKLQTQQPAGLSSAETRFTITRRVIFVSIYILGLAFILLQFEAVRNIGTGILASAGVAGIVIGMAAQNTLSNIIAGISVSFAQPVRLRDAVIFNNEWGWIEEIALMNTTIRTWDNRRIIVPNNVLASSVIQNWTIRDPTLLGVVMLYVDYTCDIEMVRGWVEEIVDQSEHATQDKVAVLQVVDFTEKTMVLRALAKGRDSPGTWNLRCEVREKLIQRFRESELPLPIIRVEGKPLEVIRQERNGQRN